MPLMVGWTGLTAQPADGDGCEAPRLTDAAPSMLSLDYSAGKQTVVPVSFAVVPILRDVEPEEATIWEEIFAHDYAPVAHGTTTPTLGPLALMALLELLRGAVSSMGVKSLVLRRQKLDDISIRVLVDNLLGGNDEGGSLVQLDLVSDRIGSFTRTHYCTEPLCCVFPPNSY
jgi:hypothetical protein